jgi:hypothetical protein
MRDHWPKVRRTIFVIAFACAAASAAWSEATEPMEAVRQYVDAFNKGDAEAMAANCADVTTREWTHRATPCRPARTFAG